MLVDVKIVVDIIIWFACGAAVDVPNMLKCACVCSIVFIGFKVNLTKFLGRLLLCLISSNVSLCLYINRVQ